MGAGPPNATTPEQCQADFAHGSGCAGHTEHRHRDRQGRDTGQHRALWHCREDGHTTQGTTSSTLSQGSKATGRKRQGEGGREAGTAVQAVLEEPVPTSVSCWSPTHLRPPLCLSSCGVRKCHSIWGQQLQWLHCPLRGWVALAQCSFLVFLVVGPHQG